VDVIFRARGEMLQKQLAYCYRLLGALETSQKWTEQLEKYPCEVALSGNGDIEALVNLTQLLFGLSIFA
jgi:hypothetical protein